MSDRPKQSLPPGRAAALIGVIALALGLAAALPRMRALLHQPICTPDSFIDVAPSGGEAVLSIVMILFLVASIMTIAVWPRAAAADGEFRPRALDAGAVQRFCFVAVVSLGCALGFFVWFLAPGSVCLSGEGVRYKAARFMAVRDFAWRDLRAIEVDCRTGKHGERAEAVFEFSDGAAFKIAGRDYLRNLGEIGAAVDAVPFHYDATRAMAGWCSRQMKARLAGRP